MPKENYTVLLKLYGSLDRTAQSLDKSITNFLNAAKELIASATELSVALKEHSRVESASIRPFATDMSEFIEDIGTLNKALIEDLYPHIQNVVEESLVPKTSPLVVSINDAKKCEAMVQKQSGSSSKKSGRGNNNIQPTRNRGKFITSDNVDEINGDRVESSRRRALAETNNTSLTNLVILNRNMVRYMSDFEKRRYNAWTALNFRLSKSFLHTFGRQMYTLTFINRRSLQENQDQALALLVPKVRCFMLGNETAEQVVGCNASDTGTVLPMPNKKQTPSTWPSSSTHSKQNSANKKTILPVFSNSVDGGQSSKSNRQRANIEIYDGNSRVRHNINSNDNINSKGYSTGAKSPSEDRPEDKPEDYIYSSNGGRVKITREIENTPSLEEESDGIY